MGKVVCVTRTSGYVASWLVKLLLQRGYTVKATVRSFGDPSKVNHLKALEGAEERLQLFEANLLVKDHLILFLMAVKKDLIDPAVKGTLNVLKSCMKASIKRVVVTSSMAAVMLTRNPTRTDFVDETWVSDPTLCEERKEWYALSKILGEKAAWKFAEENGIDLVMLHPGYVIGPLLQPTLNFSSQSFVDLINEGKELLPGEIYIYVDVRDVAQAHILAFKNSSANGRYLLVEKIPFSQPPFKYH